MKTSELTGPALDWAVAKCEGFDETTYLRNAIIIKDVFGKATGITVPINREYVWFKPSTDWAQGGPIIEREKIDVEWRSIEGCWAKLEWLDEPFHEGFGPTPLIAAMRCYVASKLGDDIDIPKELQ
jgi:hypothetical protein